MKIYIDAGHGGKDSGATKSSRFEKNDTLNLSLILGRYLISKGIEVNYSRTTDEFIDLSYRAKKANDWGADYFISIHRNSASLTATGIETWVYSKANENTISFATALNNSLVNSTGLSNRGVKKGLVGNPNLDYAVNRETVMTSFLLEIGFISNDNDNKAFDSNIEKIAKELVDTICGFTRFESLAQQDLPPQPQIVETKYKIGDNVQIVGGHKSSTDADGIMAKNLFRDYGKITRIVQARNPYLLDDGFCWVNDGLIKGLCNNEIKSVSNIKVGSIVKVKKGSKDYSGTNIASFIYSNQYRVDELKADRAVLDLKGICTAFNIADLILA